MVARFALRNDKVIVFVVIVLAVLGVRAYVTTPQSIFPAMSFARADVVADAGDLPADQVRIAIARPLGQALQTLPGVTTVIVTASQGSAEAIVDFAPPADAASALLAVDRALVQVRSSVPAATNIVAHAVDPDREPILSYALTSNELSQTVLRQIATTQIASRLYGSAGLGRLTVTGGAVPEYHVALDPAQLLIYGLSAVDVSRTLADASGVRAAGIGQRYYQSYAILVDRSLRDRASLEAIRIRAKDAAVPLATLGSVTLGVSPVTNHTSLDGRNAVIISAYAVPGADSVGMTRELKARVASLAPSLPPQIALSLVWDQTTLVIASQQALRDAIFAGALLAICVIYGFLRDLRLTLVAAVVIPLAMAIALLALSEAGQTLNLMTVGGLAVAVGLIIDDAIVILEAISRNRRERPDAGTEVAIERALQQLAVAMIASTATTVVVFLPLALLSGVTGFFFRALAFTLSASLLVSLALALLAAPIFARALLRNERPPERERDAFAALAVRYERLLRWALAHRALVALGSVVTLAVTVTLLARLPSDFLPKMDEGQFEIGYLLPAGTSLAASNAAALEMERVVRADPAVASAAGLTGVDSNGISPIQPNAGALRVRLRRPSERARYAEVSARLRDRLSATIPAAAFDFRQILEDLINDLSGTPAPIEITVAGGDDPEILNGLTQTVADKIRTVPGIVDAASGVTYDGPSIRVAPLAAQSTSLRLTTSDIGDALAALGPGTVATTLTGTQTLVPVRVAVRTDGGGSVPDPSTRLYAGGAAVALGDIATLHTRRLASDIVTNNGRMIARVTANFEGASLSAVTAGIATALRSVALPPGYSVQVGGQAQSQARSFAEFTSVVGLAIVLVYAVMLATFRSFRIPLVILTAVPLALIGVALGLFITNTAFNVSSFMGLLLLVGVVVKNGILLIDVAERRRAAGDSVHDALLAAGATRLRPILMTTLAAIGGLLPLAIGLGQGSEMEKPLAIAVIGGLSTATAFTLIVIPVIYAAFAGKQLTRVARAIAATALLLGAVTLIMRPAAAQTADAPLVFSNLSLAAATRAAVSNAPQVRAARALVDESRYALAAARAGSAPSLVTNYAQVPQGNPPGPNVISRQVSTEIQWTLGDLLGLSFAVREAGFALSASQMDEAAAETVERVKVAELYYDALKTRAVAAASADALRLAQTQRDAANVRFTAGDAARIDIVRADVTVAKAQAALELSVAAGDNANDALAIETSVAPDLLQATITQTFAPPPRAIDPQSAIVFARAARPEIAAAALTADAARAAIGSAKIARVPTLTFGAGYLSGTDSGVAVNAPSINANLTLPLGSGGRDRIGIAAARAVAAQAKAAAVERQILLDVAASARSVAALERVAAATARASASAREELVAATIGYRSGASSSLEVVAASSSYAQAIVDDLSARYDLAKASATLDIEIGR